MFFFFSSRRRHTRWNCDWSSDVCSSDLFDAGNVARVGTDQEAIAALLRVEPDECARLDHLLAQLIVLRLRAVAPVDLVGPAQDNHLFEIGRASCRERG